MTFQVQNGNSFFDLMPFVMTGGISYKRGYVEGANGMTMQNGDGIIDRIAEKTAWTVAFKPMTAADQATILGLLSPQRVTLKVTDLNTNYDTVGVFYVSDLPASYLVKRADGREFWGGLTATFTPR